MEWKDVKEIHIKIGFGEQYQYGVYLRKEFARSNEFDFWLPLMQYFIREVRRSSRIEKLRQRKSFIEYIDEQERLGLELITAEFSRSRRRFHDAVNMSDWRARKEELDWHENKDEWVFTGRILNSIYVNIYGS